jgi:hypothetical protein
MGRRKEAMTNIKPVNGHTVTTLKELVDERDRRYTEKFDAQEKATALALAYQKEAVTNAFTASEKAIVKAEEAQKAYNERSNEFRGQLDDQAKMLMPRTEAIQRIERVEGDIKELQRGESRGEGGADAKHGSRLQQNWNISTLISLIALAVVVLNFVLTKH